MKKIKLFIMLILPVVLLAGCGEKTYIELKGESVVTHTYGVEYKDEGYDIKDKKVTVTVNNEVDINKLGEQQVTYIVLKKDKEVERKVRIVKIVDDKGPEIECLDKIEIFLNTDINDDKLKEEIKFAVKDNYSKTEDIEVNLLHEIDVKKEGEYKLIIKTVDTNNNESLKEVNVKVSKIHITKISLNKDSLKLTEGQSSTLAVSYYPANTTDDKTVIWSSSNESVARVSNGKVSSVGIGNTKICATLSSNSEVNSCADVEVYKVPITKISLNQSSLSLTEGQSSTLTVSYYPSNTTDNKAITWSSSNESIAKVSNGKVTAIGIGETQVCATLNSNSNIQSCASVKVAESQISKFQKYLINQGFLKKSSTVYQRYDDGYLVKINFTDKTFSLNLNDEVVNTYYYKEDKAKSVISLEDGVVKTSNYNFANESYTCSVNISQYNELCTYANVKETDKKSFRSLEAWFYTLINEAGVDIKDL